MDFRLTVFVGRLEDVRDWDLLPDYLGKDGVSLKDQTATGPLTDVSDINPVFMNAKLALQGTWVKNMTAIWIAILNPAQTNVPEVNDSTQASFLQTAQMHLAKNLHADDGNGETARFACEAAADVCPILQGRHN